MSITNRQCRLAILGGCVCLEVHIVTVLCVKRKYRSDSGWIIRSHDTTVGEYLRTALSW